MVRKRYFPGSMGCASLMDAIGRRRRKKQGIVYEIAVFIPTLYAPASVDLVRPLRGLVSKEVLDKLSAFRGRIVSLAEEIIYLAALPKVSELQQSLAEYLPVLVGLMQERRLQASIEFKWKNLGADPQEICLPSAWFELLSVIYMMSMLSLLEANLMLLPMDSPDSSERKVSEGSKGAAVDLMLKASSYLEYCIHHILVNLPTQIRKNLPKHLQAGVLESISSQALAQGTELQLGLAQESENATLSVKRRLACEEVAYFSQAHYSLSGCNIGNAYAKKLLLFIQWKYLQAKATAYYYHGLILDKGTEPSNHVTAACCLFAADQLLQESKRVCLSFCLAVPVTRVPSAWGVMKHVHTKVPEAAAKKYQMYGYIFEQERNGASQGVPDLPEFPLSLRPDDYELPEIDAAWYDENCQPQVQSLKAHLKDEDETSTE